MSEPTHELEAFFAGDITAEQLRTLETWIHTEPANARAFLEQLHFHELVRERIRERGTDSAVVLSELAWLERSASTELIDLNTSPQTNATVAEEVDAGTLSTRDLLAVGGYLLKLSLTPKRLAYFGAAALIALCVTLAVVMSGGEAPTAVEQPAPPESPVQSIATLTGQQDARWAEANLRVGEPLDPGQTLTLTHGFAEITTKWGAQVILQAPCSVRMIDHPNAIHLNRGKLVGICESQSSKGLVVFTPDARIIDTGTRFGVAHTDATSTRVIEGEVIVSAHNASETTPSTPLTAGQSARIADDRSAVVVGPIKDARFVTHWDAVADGFVLEGEIRFDPAMPVSLGVGQSETDTIQLFLERCGLTLAEDLPVTLTEPGTYERYQGLSARISAGQIIDSYFVHMDPPGIRDEAVVRQATIRFDRPILGVIATSDHLAQTHATLGLVGTTFGNTTLSTPEDGVDPSGLEAATALTEQADLIRISEDRRTLQITLTSGSAIDQFRVLVAPAKGQQPSPND